MQYLLLPLLLRLLNVQQRFENVGIKRVRLGVLSDPVSVQLEALHV